MCVGGGVCGRGTTPFLYYSSDIIVIINNLDKIDSRSDIQ